MSSTCKSIRTLQLAALAGVCFLGTTAFAQSKGVAGTAPVLEPVATPGQPLKGSVLLYGADQDNGAGGLAPRGTGGACVLPGGQGCIMVETAEDCTNQGGAFQGAGSACPVQDCSISAAACQSFQYPRVAGTSFASMGPPNSTNLMVADDFRTDGATSHDLSQICWWGAYTNRSTPAFSCTNLPGEIDHFIVTIFEMNMGLPDVTMLVGEREQGVNMTVTRRGFCDGGNLLTFEYTATFDTAISLQPNHCYAIQIRNPNDDSANWFWSRSEITVNSQCWQRAGEVPFTVGGAQVGDRAFCLNVGLEIFHTCAVPPPPICENPDENGYSRSGANTGLFSADPSAPGVGLQLANSLQFATSDPISNVCFWGFWVAPDGTQPAGPDVPDFWFTIYDSDGPDGLPGTELLRGHTGVDAGFVTRRMATNYNIAFPAFNPEPNHCYYFSISFPQDNSDPAHAFRFAWGAASTIPPANPLSNFYSASRTASPPGAWAFQNFGNPDIAETSMVFDQPGVLPSCGTPPPPPPPPANDDCANAASINGEGTFEFDNRGATCEANERTASCATSGTSIWYAWTPACDGTYTVSMCEGSTDDNVLSAYEGSDCGSATEVACGDDTCNVGGGPATITFTAGAGTTYLLRVATWAGAECGQAVGSEGTFTISRDEGPCKGGCPCDFNNSGNLNSQDFFDFLVQFFANDPSADFNDDGAVNSQDFFDFLTCFFEPPSGCK